MVEKVVLVDDANNVLGTFPKSEVHTDDTPLHRGFSCFMIDSHGQTLIQQRAGVKKTWPLVWSNTVCGHPALDEKGEEAVKRRLMFELGLDIEIDDIHLILPDFRYKAVFQGVMENELCPVFVVFSDKEPSINPDEVEATKRIDFWEWHDCIVDPGCTKYDDFSVWCREEVELLGKSDEFKTLFYDYCNQ